MTPWHPAAQTDQAMRNIARLLEEADQQYIIV
jgi:hypothetical protein